MIRFSLSGSPLLSVSIGVNTFREDPHYNYDYSDSYNSYRNTPTEDNLKFLIFIYEEEFWQELTGICYISFPKAPSIRRMVG